VDYYRDKTPAERLQIAFFSIKEHLNINGPPASIENIIEGKEDDLLFLYLEKIKLFYCTSYGPSMNPNIYGSTKSLNRSHSLNAADNKHTIREYRSQTSSPYPPLYANNSYTNLESINETTTTTAKRKIHRNPRPHSYHELSTTHLMSSSGARVIAVETGSASELEEDDDVDSDTLDRTAADKTHAQVANASNKVSQNSPASKMSSNYSQLNNVALQSSDLKNKTTSPAASPQKSAPDQVKSSSASNDGTKSQDSSEERKHSGRVVTPTRHQLPPLPKVAPPPPPVVASVKRQIATQMESTDTQNSLQTFLSLSQSRKNMATAVACETCTETQAKVENIIKQERELVIRPLQRACKFSLCTEQI